MNDSELMTTNQLSQSMLTSRVWTFLALLWLFRGVDLLITGIGYGYSWLKHGFPINNLSAIGEVRYSDWVKLICFIVGIVILVQQHRHRKAVAAHLSELNQ